MELKKYIRKIAEIERLGYGNGTGAERCRTGWKDLHPENKDRDMEKCFGQIRKLADRIRFDLA